ncbi:hypothetical protein C8R45DRAFT_519088 [Mycena sanguinolenta]|nr:hypothetical protein C8R45DRAFT_519088 [Mycena sanguinolenta]
MLPHTSRSHKPSPYPVITPAPGHQRNRIACTNCRKKKIKCMTEKKNPSPTTPCERCSKEGLKCEYVAISNNEGSSSRPDILWVEPLDPESYARSQRAFSPPPASHNPAMHPGYPAQPAGPPSGQFTPHGYSSSSQYFPPAPGSGFHPGMPRMPGNQPPAAVNAAYPGTNPPPNYYGGSAPGNFAYSWSQPQVHSSYDGCICPTAQCMCGRRRA